MRPRHAEKVLAERPAAAEESIFIIYDTPGFKTSQVWHASVIVALSLQASQWGPCVAIYPEM